MNYRNLVVACANHYMNWCLDFRLTTCGNRYMNRPSLAACPNPNPNPNNFQPHSWTVIHPSLFDDYLVFVLPRHDSESVSIAKISLHNVGFYQTRHYTIIHIQIPTMGHLHEDPNYGSSICIPQQRLTGLLVPTVGPLTVDLSRDYCIISKQYQSQVHRC